MDVSDVKGADLCGYDSHLYISNSDNVSFERFDMRWNQQMHMNIEAYPVIR
jgi:hypothetical protein